MKYKSLGLTNTNEMLERALLGDYAVPAYNFSNMEQLQAILTACEQTNRPLFYKYPPAH